MNAEDIMSARVCIDSKITKVGKQCLVFGVGVNDAWFKVKIRSGGHQLSDKSYDAWKSMLRRCYSDKCKKDWPTYRYCTVCEEWLVFSNFDRWFLQNYKDGFQLDKDILVAGNKLYSPETCLLVPQWLNSFVTGSEAIRGQYPIGVCWHKTLAKYAASCKHPKSMLGRRHLGYFSTPDEAYNAWLDRKLNIALERKPEMDEIDPRIYSSVIRKIKNMK